MSAFSQYFESLQTKLRTCSYIEASSNVVFGEYPDISGLADEYFPRLETLLTKVRCNGYVDQRNMSWSLRYDIAGYIRRETKESYNLSATEMGDIINFGKTVCDLNYSFLNDKQAGNSPCTGFMMLGQYPEIYSEFELFPKTSAFIFDMEAIIYLPDTEVLA